MTLLRGAAFAVSALVAVSYAVKGDLARTALWCGIALFWAWRLSGGWRR